MASWVVIKRRSWSQYIDEIAEEEFTGMAWQAIVSAPRDNSRYVNTEDLMRSLLEQQDGFAPLIFAKIGVNNTQLLEATNQYIQIHSEELGESPESILGNELEASINRARACKKKRGLSYISVEHLILALAKDDRFGKQLFKDFQLSRGKLKSAIQAIQKFQPTTHQDAAVVEHAALRTYGTDFTALAKAGKFRPMIGRDDEIRRCMRILSSVLKPNPILIGEPGTGKTSIVEGVAQRIVEGNVPDTLKSSKLISLDVGALLGSSRNRGEFEDIFKTVLNEIIQSKGKIVLFIDEIHMIVGAGATNNSMDAGNLMKPMLGRGELRCIGATTPDEYRKYFEVDKALVRRFQPVLVEEPTVEETIFILRGLRERLEWDYGVRISDTAIVKAAALSDRYIGGRCLPDKAIDLVDEAASELRMEKSLPAAIDEIRRSISKLKEERLRLINQRDKDSGDRLSQLEADLPLLQKRETQLVEQWEYEKPVQSIKEKINQVNLEIQRAQMEYGDDVAVELNWGRLAPLHHQLSAAEMALAEHMHIEKPLLKEELTENEIGEIISKSSGIPLSQLQQSEREKLMFLEEEIHKRVVGQESAVKAVANAIRRSRAGISDPNRPIASFMFLGPTGVGKTELAKAIASCLFNTEAALVRFDMSEYMEKNATTKLIGPPPGYVGYHEGGQLTEMIRMRPYATVLFDEIEKAHKEVFNVFLQILDDGRVTDGKGKTVNFTNTIIMMTSNIGSEHINRMEDDTEESVMQEVMSAARSIFRPEFMNRVDKFIVFRPLNLDQIKTVTRLQLKRLQERIADMNMRIEVSDAAFELIGSRGYDPNNGARPIKRLIEEEVGDELSTGIIQGDFRNGDTIAVDAEGQKLVLRKM